MLNWILPLVLLCVAVSSTRIKLNNYCRQPLLITETTDTPVPLCNLPAGFACYQDYDNSNKLVLRNNYTPNSTYVQVSINSNSKDWYAIRTNQGFDIQTQVMSSNGGPLLSCADSNCADSFDRDSTKRGWVNTNGVINVNYCPYNQASVRTNSLFRKELPLVETIHAGFKTKA